MALSARWKQGYAVRTFFLGTWGCSLSVMWMSRKGLLFRQNERLVDSCVGDVCANITDVITNTTTIETCTSIKETKVSSLTIRSCGVIPTETNKPRLRPPSSSLVLPTLDSLLPFLPVLGTLGSWAFSDGRAHNSTDISEPLKQSRGIFSSHSITGWVSQQV